MVFVLQRQNRRLEQQKLCWIMMLMERIVGVGHFLLSFRNGFIPVEIIPVHQLVDRDVAKLVELI